MTRLARVPELMSSEPLPTYLSRLGAANGARSLRDFRKHMGIGRSMEAGDICRRVGAITGIDVNALMSHSLDYNHQWLTFDTHRLSTQTLFTKAPRYCPKCLNEDVGTSLGRLDVRLSTRFAWLVTSIDVCPVHRARIVTSQRAYPTEMRLDFAAHVRNNWREIEEAIAEVKEIEVHAFDSYFSDRIEGKQSGNEVLDPLPYFVALRLCTIIGEMASPFEGRGRTGVRYGATHPSRRIGFELLSSRSAILSFLTDQGRSFVRNHHRKALGLYGQFGEYLNAHLDMPELQPLIGLVREHAFETVPIGPEDGFLGNGGTRRWHTLRSAELETGVYFTVLRKILVERGVISSSEQAKKDSSIVISVAEIEAAAAAYHDRISIEGLANRVGLLHVTVRKLVRAGVFKPVYGTADDMKAMFSRKDIDSTIASVTEGLEIRPPSPDLVPLRSATRGFGRDLTEVIAPLLGGRLSMRYLDTDASRIGFDRILLDRQEVRSLFVQAPPGLKRHEFALKLGLDHHTANAFFDSGFFEIVRWDAVRNRKPFDVVKTESFERFFRDHDSLAKFAEGWMRPGELLKALTAAAIRPVWACRERSIANFYRRSDVEGFRKRSA